jgi:predicted transport protein
MGTSIELWTYRLFANPTLFIEEAQQKELISTADTSAQHKNPVMVEAGRNAALTRKSGVYTFDAHLKNKPQDVTDIALAAQEFVMSLGEAIEERPKKFYIAYRTTQNVVCMEVQKRKVILFLKLSPKKVKFEPGFFRDVSDIGHFGTGDVEVTLVTLQDRAKPLIQQALNAVGV